MDIKLSETVNGYPMIEVPAPYELVGEFLKVLHTAESAKVLLTKVHDLIDGKLISAQFPQDYALLKLSHEEGTALLWLDDLSQGVERTCEMSLNEFVDIAQKWLNFLELRDSEAS